MKLSNLHVFNYRALRDVSIPLSRFACITGENNSGKSSVLQTLSLFLSGSPLKESDYFDPAQSITIAVSITDITESDLQLLAEEHRERIRPLVENGNLTLVRRYRTDERSEFGYLGLVPKDARFGPDNVTKLVEKKKGGALRDAVLTVFPELSGRIDASATQAAVKDLIRELSDTLPADQKIRCFVDLPTGFDKSVTPMLPERIYIPAVKDLADETKTAESSSFGKILAIVMKTIEPLLAEEKDLFEKLSKKLTRLVRPDGKVQDDRLDEIKNIERTLQRYVRETFTNVSLEIEIPPPELKSVLSTARILADDGVKGPLELKGDGLRRAVVFSILRTYVEFARLADKQGIQKNQTDRGYLLLFEEPELFLHPDGQKVLFEALGLFAKRNHVVVTTHSPLFFGPNATATFIRFSKVKEPGVSKPFSKSWHVDLSDINPRDEFQIICFENNSAAFFAKRIVLVEGDSDYIVFPYIAAMLNPDWDCQTQSVAFIRVGGKGSIHRYRRFFRRFDVPVFVISDLDALDDGFEKLEPTEEAKSMRSELIRRADAANVAAGASASVRTDDIQRAQTRPEIRRLWEEVRAAKNAYDLDKTRFAELDVAVDAFFAWEKKNLQRECIRKAEQAEVKAAKLALIWELRKNGVFILERGQLEDYYPPTISGPDKPSRAQGFLTTMVNRDQIIGLCPKQTCPMTGAEKSEFEFVFASVFG